MKQLFISMVLLVSSEAVAQIKLPSFSSLCAYDSLCSKVGSQSGGKLTVKKPKPELISYYTRLRPAIIQIAKEYNIDPVTLALAPLAENTMNVSATDAVQDALVSNGAAPEGVFLGREMSIGPGQIYTSVANKVEPIAARIENRPIRTKKEITKVLLTPEGGLRYAAALMREAQDIYGKAGVDISKRPEILSTLYNIGKPALRLRNAGGRQPLPNYFGYFVGANYNYVQKVLQLPSILPTTAPVVMAQAQGEKTVEIAFEKPTKSFLKSTQLFANPPVCFPSGAKIASKALTTAAGFYDISGYALDCALNPWVLISMENGKLGWISQASLKAQTESQELKDTKNGECAMNANRSCLPQVKAIAQNMGWDVSAGGGVFVGLQPAGRVTTGMRRASFTSKERGQYIDGAVKSAAKNALKNMSTCLRTAGCFLSENANQLKQAGLSAQSIESIAKSVTMFQLPKLGKDGISVSDICSGQAQNKLVQAGMKLSFLMKDEIGSVCASHAKCIQAGVNDIKRKAGDDTKALQSACVSTKMVIESYYAQILNEAGQAMLPTAAHRASSLSARNIEDLAAQACVEKVLLPSTNEIERLFGSLRSAKVMISNTSTSSGQIVLQLRNACR